MAIKAHRAHRGLSAHLGRRASQVALERMARGVTKASQVSRATVDLLVPLEPQASLAQWARKDVLAALARKANLVSLEALGCQGLKGPAVQKANEVLQVKEAKQASKASRGRKVFQVRRDLVARQESQGSRAKKAHAV